MQQPRCQSRFVRCWHLIVTVPCILLEMCFVVRHGSRLRRRDIGQPRHVGVGIDGVLMLMLVEAAHAVDRRERRRIISVRGGGSGGRVHAVVRRMRVRLRRLEPAQPAVLAAERIRPVHELRRHIQQARLLRATDRRLVSWFRRLAVVVVVGRAVGVLEVGQGFGFVMRRVPVHASPDLTCRA